MTKPKQTEEERKAKAKIQMREWRASHPEQAKATAKAYCIKNKEKMRAVSDAWAIAHPDRIKTHQAKWREANPKKVKEGQEAWRTAHKEKTLLQMAAYREANRDRMNAYSAAYREKYPKKVKAWRDANPEKVRGYIEKYRKAHLEVGRTCEHNRRALKKNNGGKLSSNVVIRLLVFQKNRCAVCRKSLNKTGYHIDHIIPLSKGGKNNSKNIQATCPTCNMQKGAKDPIAFMQSRGFLL